MAQPLSAAISDFYVSRAEPSTTAFDGAPGAGGPADGGRRAEGGRASSTFSIRGVVPPDEFAIGFPLYSGVDDSVYTNAAAMQV